MFKLVASRRVAAVLTLLLAQGAPVVAGDVPKHATPIPAATLAAISAKETTSASPILVRIYKKEAELEVWKKARNGRFVLLKTFPICRWSGQLGPKLKQGDRQAPEGFYSVGPRQMNPNSSYHLSFDIGYPNAYDRTRGASGAHLMVHGACSSAGCFAMTDENVEEVYALAREAFAGGQPAFQVHSFPFRMTARNMARHRSDPNIAFWRQLKEGSDRFEALGEEPAVSVASGRYVFAPSADPVREALAVARRAEEDARIEALVAEGSAAVRTTYADGGQHASFMAFARRGGSLGDVSRPEALAFAGREVVITPARRKPPRPAENAEATGAVALAPRPPAFVDGSAEPSEIEEAVFGPTLLGYGAMVAALHSQPPLPGSVEIVPAGLSQTPVEVAAKR